MPRSCRHGRAWCFYFDGVPSDRTPRWCPECGALRHVKWIDKNETHRVTWFYPAVGATPLHAPNTHTPQTPPASRLPTDHGG